MTPRRLLAIVFIFIATSVAWAILGATVFTRTYSTNNMLRGKVEGLWGSEQTQAPPSASWREEVSSTEEVMVDNRKEVRTKKKNVWRTLPLAASRVNASLNLDHRRKGLLWYSTYAVQFAGEYTFENNSSAPTELQFDLPLPAQKAIYDGVRITRNGAELPFVIRDQKAVASSRLAPGEAVVIAAAYRSQGLDRWTYKFGETTGAARDLEVKVRTNFSEVDFAENTLSPTAKRAQGGGWELTWSYRNLLSGVPIAVVMPQKLQPGPLAGEISFFAPVSLFFFFFLMVVITTLRRIDLHPMNYFFLAAAFFAFHLLLVYLADHISIHAAFVISAAVSLGLVISYLRLVVGERFAWREAGLAQLVYLVLFSYAFFFPGFTGLTVTIGAILTLFVLMQWTARVNWAERLGGSAAPPPVPAPPRP
ncbi:MAG: inner membrane CreD family protein [Bryobacter sp.]|nr:inner membrane CreD family protein [Bryobacter sp.]